MDSMHITIQRTGAATAVAARLLAKPGPTVVTVCGCGNQGRIQLAALARVRPVAKAYAYARDINKVKTFCEEMSRSLGISVSPAGTLNAAARESSVVLTCTS